MHPDDELAGLRKELERAGNDPERRKQIEAEIKHVEQLPRPQTRPENLETTVDHRVAYVHGLERELERADPARRSEIEQELKRVRAEVRGTPKLVEKAVNPPAAE